MSNEKEKNHYSKRCFKEFVLNNLITTLYKQKRERMKL